MAARPPAAVAPPTIPLTPFTDQPSAVADRTFCGAMLPRVSRTFAVCIRLLPARLDHSVLVAYLLCRVADTLEDSTRIVPAERQRLLEHFRRCVGGHEPDATPLRAAFPDPATDEELLVRESNAVLRELNRLPGPHRAVIRPFVEEMCAGMQEFTARTRGAPAGQVALDTVEELERYCYYVAGTVGHLLTELFRLHVPRMAAARYRRLKSLATSFGLGLQLTNIIKDVGDDRRRGWTFVPRQLCQLAGIRPEDLQDVRHRPQAERVMGFLIEKTKRHLCDALAYSAGLPRREYRVRLFCLASLYFAVRTIRLAERDRRLLDPEHKVKITRNEVHRTLRITHVVAPSNLLVRAYFRHLAGSAWGCG
jgi:farnesyl-diphosphate farnesyltransferase